MSGCSRTLTQLGKQSTHSASRILNSLIYLLIRHHSCANLGELPSANLAVKYQHSTLPSTLPSPTSITSKLLPRSHVPQLSLPSHRPLNSPLKAANPLSHFRNWCLAPRKSDKLSDHPLLQPHPILFIQASLYVLFIHGLRVRLGERVAVPVHVCRIEVMPLVCWRKLVVVASDAIAVIFGEKPKLEKALWVSGMRIAAWQLVNGEDWESELFYPLLKGRIVASFYGVHI